MSDTRKELTSDATKELAPLKPVELTEAEIDTVAGGDSFHLHINNIRLANNITIGEINFGFVRLIPV